MSQTKVLTKPSAVFSVTPKQLRTFFRVLSTTTKGRGVKQRGRIRILTETPKKEELEQMAESKKDLRRKLSPPFQRKQEILSVVDKGEDIEDELQECLFMDDSSDESLRLRKLEPDNLLSVNILAADDFVAAIFFVGKEIFFILPML